LRAARENYLQSLRLQPDRVDALISLGDTLALLGELTEDDEESEQVFAEGVANFDRALKLEEGDTDALNEYGILLTKRAQKLLKQVRKEEELEAQGAFDKVSHSSGGGSGSETGDGGSEERLLPSAEARKEARRKKIIEAENMFNQAEKNFLELKKKGVWYGTLNLACLAALRFREDECRRWLEETRQSGQLAAENLDDRDFDYYRNTEWFVKMKQELIEEAQRERERSTKEEGTDGLNPQMQEQ
jgi:hypothetical protein